jgi:hypothetical protein
MIVAYTNKTRIIEGSSDALENEWQHIALVRQGSTMTLYLNGSSIGTTTNSTTFSGPIRPGCEYYADVAYPLDGFMDEYRVSKTARYTTNFTPPTRPFGGGLRMKAPDGKVYALSLSGSI